MYVLLQTGLFQSNAYLMSGVINSWKMVYCRVCAMLCAFSATEIVLMFMMQLLFVSDKVIKEKGICHMLYSDAPAWQLNI